MAIDVSTLTDYTWAQIKIAAKHAMVTAAVGGAQLNINGRNIGRITISEAKALYQLADEMEQTDAESETGGLNALAEFGDAR